MNKFWTTLLKIIMVISFTGVIVFVALAIVYNHNVAYEAYNYISNYYDTSTFENFSTKVNLNMKENYNGPVSVYAKYIDKSIEELNEGCNAFLDYLSVEKDLTKGEQDKLRKLFDDYTNKFKICEQTYDDYIVSYQDADYKYNNETEDSHVALNTVISKCCYFVDRYTDCYVSGSNFFKNLVYLVKKYSFNGNQYFNYTEQTYLIKVGIVDYTTEFVYANMKYKKDNDLENFKTNVRTNDLVDCFYIFAGNYDKFENKQAITNFTLQKYVDNLNCLNIFDFAGNFDEYVDTLTDDLKQKANEAKIFFNDNFMEE